MQVAQRTPGRVITVVLEPGEQLMASLAAVAEQRAVRQAQILVRGHLAAARLILGLRKYSRATDDLDRVSFDDGREVVGSGEIREAAPGRTEVDLRCTVGREREVFVADIVEATVGRGVRLTLLENVDVDVDKEPSS